MAADLNTQLWQQFVQGLTGNLSGSPDPRSFLPTNGLALADWEVMDTTGLPAGNPAAKNGDPIVANLEAWADSMPSWQPIYVPGNSLYDAYTDFLNAIALTGGDPTLQQIADGYATKLKTARGQLSADMMAVNAGWTTFNASQSTIPVASQTSYVDWYNQVWAATISGDTANLNAANTNYLKALQAVGGPDYATVSRALTNATLGQGNAITDPATGASRPRYEITGGLNDWYETALQSVTSGKPAQINFTLDLGAAASGSYQESNYSNSSSSGGAGLFFWGGSGSSSSSSSGTASDYSLLTQKLTMKYVVQEATVFTVNPGTWFDGTMIDAFYDKISAGSAFAPPKTLFGENGLLALRTAQIYVAFRRSITLTGDTATISQVFNTFQQSSSTNFSIGGFFWSGSASTSQGSQNSQVKTNKSTDGKSITISDNTDAPKVIGIVPLSLSPNP